MFKVLLLLAVPLMLFSTVSIEDIFYENTKKSKANEQISILTINTNIEEGEVKNDNFNINISASDNNGFLVLGWQIYDPFGIPINEMQKIETEYLTYKNFSVEIPIDQLRRDFGLGEYKVSITAINNKYQHDRKFYTFTIQSYIDPENSTSLQSILNNRTGDRLINFTYSKSKQEIFVLSNSADYQKIELHLYDLKTPTNPIQKHLIKTYDSQYQLVKIIPIDGGKIRLIESLNGEKIETIHDYINNITQNDINNVIKDVAEITINDTNKSIENIQESVVKYGALAYSRDTGEIGISYSASNKEIAKEIALKECSASDCKILNTVIKGRCMALATTEDHRGYGWARRNILEVAEESALKACEKDDTRICSHQVSFCIE